MLSDRKTSSIWNPAFIIMLTVNLFNSAGQYMIGSALPKYSNFLGASPVIIGLVTSAFSISALLVRPITGSALDYYNKKIMLTISLALTTVMYTVCAFTDNVTVLVLTRFIDGIGASVKVPLCLALATEFLPEEKVGSGIGIYSVAQAISSALGPGICLDIIEKFGYQASLLFIAFIALIALILALAIRSGPYARPDRPFAISLKNVFAKEALLPALIVLTLAMPYACTMAYLPIIGELHNVSNIGLYYTVYSIVLFIGRPLCGKMLDRVHFTRILIPSLISYAISMVFISASDKLSGFLIAGVFSAMGYGIAHPCLQSLCMKWVPKEKRGASGNTYYIGVDIGNFTGSLLTGKFIDTLLATESEADAYSHAFLLLLIPIAISLVVTIYAGCRRRMIDNGQRKEGLIT